MRLRLAAWTDPINDCTGLAFGGNKVRQLGVTPPWVKNCTLRR